VATLVGASPKEIVFTSGATESNNIATKGVAHFYKGKKRHIITTQTDHKCVLDSCRYLQQEVSAAPVTALHRLTVFAFQDLFPCGNGVLERRMVRTLQRLERLGQ
jgi:cysteine sulfinate desulfinase/cysteine desulfurase-like protein